MPTATWGPPASRVGSESDWVAPIVVPAVCAARITVLSCSSPTQTNSIDPFGNASARTDSDGIDPSARGWLLRPSRIGLPNGLPRSRKTTRMRAAVVGATSPLGS